MGKLQSKHLSRVCRTREGPEGEAILGSSNFGNNTRITLEPIDEQIWKQKCATGFNLANYQGARSECSFSLMPSSKTAGLADDQIPLRVALPPLKKVGESEKVLLLDKDLESAVKPDLDAETTDNNMEGGMSLEGLECGVSLKGTDKQEWSFTLYDFDGKGSVTKEDLASLLKALYDAVGQSISLPQSASTSKKLRLRLTVSPDAAKSGNKVKETKDKVRKETLKNVKYSSKIPNKDTTKAATPKDTVKVRGEKESWKIHKPASDKANKESSNQKEQTNDLSGKSSGKAKLSATEEKQLAELIQRNMIKQQRLQSCHRHLRRHNSDHHHGEEVKKRHSHHRNSGQPQESQDRRNYYLDLAGVENTSPSNLLNTSAPAKLLSSSTGPSPRRSHGRSHDQHLRRTLLTVGENCEGPNHSRSHDLGVKYGAPTTPGKPEELAEEVLRSSHSCENHTKEHCDSNNHRDHGRDYSKSPKLPKPKMSPATKGPKPNMTSTPKGSKCRPVSLPTHVPENGSPHHHRRHHRQRERNRDMAMQHVAEWIDKEHQHEMDGENMMVQHHEHHHVHEHHHHHHYHHYQET